MRLEDVKEHIVVIATPGTTCTKIRGSLNDGSEDKFGPLPTLLTRQEEYSKFLHGYISTGFFFFLLAC